MKNPVIEVREHTVTVMPEFAGHIEGLRARTRSNLVGNPLRHVVDSAGDVWPFEYTSSDRTGLRGVFSALVWNISSDTYHVTRHAQSVEGFRQILQPYLRAPDPDDRELAAALLESLAELPGQEPLSRHIELLNL